MKLSFKHFGSGPPVIFLHGLYGSGDNWYSIGKALSKQLEIFLVDLRNHGSSPHDAEMSNFLMSNDIEEFLVENNLTNVSIIGHSMGGKVAMNFALQNPQKVSKLVIIDIALRPYGAAGKFERETNLHRKIIDSLGMLDISASRSRTDIDRQLSEFLPQKPLRDFILKNLKRRNNGEFYWSLNIESLKNNILKILEGIDAGDNVYKGPVLLIVGKQSDYVIPEDYNDFKRVFPQLKIEEFETGHWVHAEQPGKIINVLAEFLLDRP